MDTTLNTRSEISPRSTHPLVIIAAVAITLFSAVGIAALMGWLPSSTATPAPLVSALDSKAAPALPSSSIANDREAAREQTPAPTRPHVTQRAAAPKPAAAPKLAPPVQMAAVEPPPLYAPAPAPVQPPLAAAEPPRPAVCIECGVIEAVRPVEQKPASGSGIGAVAGGLLGGIVGHQVGAGRGRDLATVAGAVGGAFAGNAVEKNRNVSTTYEVTVRFDDNTTQRLTLAQAPVYRAGDRVRMVNGSLRPL